jgi:hypothetical protein
VKLGWRWSRASQMPQAQAVTQRTFEDLQHFFTWPHFDAEVADASSTTTFASVGLTVVDDPYTLLSVASRIQVPRDFDSWWFIGRMSVKFFEPNAGKLQVGFKLDGATDDDLMTDTYCAGSVDWRSDVTVIYPVSKGNYLVPCVRSPNNTFITACRVKGFFLPHA